MCFDGTFHDFVIACHSGSGTKSANPNKSKKFSLVGNVEQFIKSDNYRPNDKDFFGWAWCHLLYNLNFKQQC